MLRFFASLAGCVAILSGVLMGWVRYAQHDPEYSCLSFDNITVQLDTSLFFRRFYPTALYQSPDTAINAYLETEYTHANRLLPLPLFNERIEAGRRFLTFQNTETGERRIIKEIYGISPHDTLW